MATRLLDRPTAKAQRFIDANATARLVYQSTTGDGCMYRLEDDQTFELSTADCLSIRDYEPRWRHLSGTPHAKR
jgi:hypothetical protein